MDAASNSRQPHIDSLIDTHKWSDYALNLPVEARTRYEAKLFYNFGQNILPDPYLLKSGWSDDPTLWPDVDYPDIYTYLIESPGHYTTETLKAYKSLDAYRYSVSFYLFSC